MQHISRQGDHLNVAKFVRKAKLPVWNKFWNTLRANRETDLMDSHGIRLACTWIGNSVRVAMENYRIQKGSDFADEGFSTRMQKRMTQGREPESTADTESSEPSVMPAIPMVGEATNSRGGT